jgi:hypothetical protein
MFDYHIRCDKLNHSVSNSVPVHSVLGHPLGENMGESLPNSATLKTHTRTKEKAFVKSVGTSIEDKRKSESLS